MALANFNAEDDCQTKSDWIVMKFGGSSVGDPNHWETIASQVQKQVKLGNRPLVVLSALKNVSNLLESLLHQSLAGVHSNAIFHLKEFHLSFCSQLGMNLNVELEGWFVELETDCHDIYQSQKITPMLHAKILAVGELLSSTIGNAFLNCSLGSPNEMICKWQDARLLLKNNQRPGIPNESWHHYLSGECDYEYDENFIGRSPTLSEASSVIVTQGFIASDANNSTILLGREGSDTSAAYFASLLGAKEIQIWTDVPGIFSCNPQSNSNARQIKKVHYRQARQMAKMGAKVLHQRTIAPAERYSIPIVVKSTQLPEEEGTRIDSFESNMKAVVSVANVTAVFLAETTDDIDNKGIARFLHRLYEHGYNLILKYKQSAQFGYVLVLKYSNSDQKEPSEEALEKDIQDITKMADLNCRCLTNLSLISIIGSQPDGESSKEVREKLSVVNSIIESRIQALKNGEDTRNRYLVNLGTFLQDDGENIQSLLVSSETQLELETTIHDEIVAKAQDRDCFGQDWVSFCPQ